MKKIILAYHKVSTFSFYYSGGAWRCCNQNGGCNALSDKGADNHHSDICWSCGHKRCPKCHSFG